MLSRKRGIAGKRLAGAVTGLAALASLAIAAAFPVAYLIGARDRLLVVIEVHAQLFAHQVSDAASQSPELFNAFLGTGASDPGDLLIAVDPDADAEADGVHAAPEMRRVLALDGHRLFEIAPRKPLVWPVFTRLASVKQNGNRLGDVEVARSLRPQLRAGLGIAAASLTCGMVILLLLRAIPLRLMNGALDRVAFLAAHDQLTGLPNRHLLMDLLERAIARAARNRARCALLFLDMDGFKHVNDTLGHAIGDELLRLAAKELQGTLRECDTVSRLGGDEFVIILETPGSPADAEHVAGKLLDRVSRIRRVDGWDVVVSFSVGIALYPDHARNAAELLMRADAAMYQAKAAGRGSLALFDEGMERQTRNRVAIRADLTKALELGEFLLLYQSKVDLRSGKVIGAEALIRWMREPGHYVLPDEFIPVAEESGLILPIGKWILREACRQIRAWRDAGLPPVRVAVNVSTKSLRDPGFSETVREMLQLYDLPSEALEIEITETAAMTDPERSLAILRELRDFGLHVAIDDFGTGFSSLAYLQRLPADTIKIDRTFINHMETDDHSIILVRAIISMAKALRKHVVAEGVETQAQRAQLLRLGCYEAQGYLFSEPVDAASFRKMLECRARIAEESV